MSFSFLQMIDFYSHDLCHVTMWILRQHKSWLVFIMEHTWLAH